MKKTEEEFILNNDNEIFYGKGGNQVENSEAFAKILETKTGNYYFVWLSRGSLFDPYGINSVPRNSSINKFVRVSKDVFDNYFKYLKTKNMAFYTKARRDYRG
jgi:hypothetical protein